MRVLSALNKMNFMTENILASNKYGFRSGNNITDCLINLTDEIAKTLNQ